MIRVLALALALALAGCAAIDEARKVQDPDNRRPGERTVTAEEAGLGADATLSVTKGIGITLRHNPVVAFGRARVERAQAVLEQVNAGYYPQLSFGADYRWQKVGGAGSNPSSGSTRMSPYISLAMCSATMGVAQ